MDGEMGWGEQTIENITKRDKILYEESNRFLL